MKAKPYALYIAALALLIGAIAAELFIWGRFVLVTKEFEPGIAGLHWIRSGAIALSMLLIVEALRRAPRAAETQPLMPLLREPDGAFQNAAKWVALGIGMETVALFVFKTHRFLALLGERNVVETASALLLLGASLLVAWRSWKLARGGAASTLWIAAAALSALLFLVAMEEMSWGEHYLGRSALSFLAPMNAQSEGNLHNVATHEFEITYYAGTTLFTLVIPLLFERTSIGSRFATLAPLTPSSALIPTALLMNFHSGFAWNSVALQAGFYLSAVLTAYAIAQFGKQRRYFDLAFAVLALLTQVIGQFAFLSFYSVARKTTRCTICDPSSEYRELQIAWALFAMAMSA